jgi:acyl-coenzyme A synthetase/AMP-(fatty) acid ligase
MIVTPEGLNVSRTSSGCQHVPGVRDSAVVGATIDPEECARRTVLDAGISGRRRAAGEWMLDDHQKIRRARLPAELPRTEGRKLKRAEIREWVGGGAR